MQEIDDQGANPIAGLDWRRDPLGERWLGWSAAPRAGADMGAMFGDEQGLWLGQVEHLPGAVARGHGRRQRRPAEPVQALG